MSRQLKYKAMVNNITEWIKDELKNDASMVNGLSVATDGTEDIIQGRYEVCRELLHYIRSIGGEEHDALDTE